MAHFAKLNELNQVVQVIVIHNNELLDKHGNEQEQLGVNFCKSLFGQSTNWVQTSYNNNFRNKYAALGDIYDLNKDEFITPET